MTLDVSAPSPPPKECGPTATCLLDAGSPGEDLGLRGRPSPQDTSAL